MVPAATLNSVVDLLYEQTAAALKAPDVLQIPETIDFERIVARGADVTKRVQSDQAKCAPIVKKAKIRVD